MKFHPAAVVEHLDQLAFYQSKSTALAAAYLSDVEDTLAYLSEGVQRFPVVAAPDIRSVALKRFPFNILFRQHAGHIQILAIAHKRRRPMFWAPRLSP